MNEWELIGNTKKNILLRITCTNHYFISTFAALFLLDCGSVLYLWQGAFPGEEEGEEAGATTGSGLARWQAERRAAMQTLLSYRKARYGQPVPAARLVWAGHEPQEFINHFPYWTHNPDTARANREVSEFCRARDFRLTRQCLTVQCR